MEKLGLSPGQQTDVRTQSFVNGTQTGAKIALKHWRITNPIESTFRALLFILLSLLKGDVAVRVCKYLYNKCKLIGLHVPNCKLYPKHHVQSRDMVTLKHTHGL